ncbi:hypothetical protein Tsubulata_027624 [Turnera subulata]|uniref:F-box domain-containing protein n=1 Tax=Turnera subulata TaxID=218843 RepID=A0A9Q0JIW7_9ROSI|nr:hypothetical protein Tsubulata_027624 [Turnera subulata]
MANLTLPSVIVEEILAMLPIKSIHRFRQLSKSWSSFLVSSEFQKLRTNNSTPPETNLEKILQCSAVNGGYVIESLGCLGDGEDPVRLQFPTDKFVWFWGSCNGLVCVTVPDVLIGGERKIIAFDLAKEKFYGVPLPAVEKELCDILRFKELGVAGDYLCLCFVSKSDNITIVGLMKECCKSWVHFIGYNSLGYARTYSCQDFVPQAGKDGGYVILHFPGGQQVLKWDNLDEETDESGGFSLNIKSSEFRMTIAYTEALTSPYASP